TAVESSIFEELEHLSAHDPSFAPALASFYKARVSGNEELAISAIAWLRGEHTLSTAAQRQIGVKGTLRPDQVLPRLRAFLQILRGTYLKGLVVLIDELELVRRRPHKQTRDKAYETIRALLDAAGQNSLPGTLIVSTGTDEFFEDPRHGIPSYEALA